MYIYIYTHCVHTLRTCRNAHAIIELVDRKDRYKHTHALRTAHPNGDIYVRTYMNSCTYIYIYKYNFSLLKLPSVYDGGFQRIKAGVITCFAILRA